MNAHYNLGLIEGWMTCGTTPPEKVLQALEELKTALGIEELKTALGNAVTASVEEKKPRKYTRRKPVPPEQIARMQEGLRKMREAKKQAGDGAAGESSAPQGASTLEMEL